MYISNKFKYFLIKILSKFIKSIQYSIGMSHIANMRFKYKKIKNINDLDFKIFSQNGEDGIIDYLLYSLKIQKPKFIEIGVGDYSECNTRFIFERTSPKGLIIDCLKNLEKKVKKNLKLWKGELTIVEKFINSKNIIETLNTNNFYNKIDLFSLDIDGIDYWVLEKLPKNFSKICVIEYNPTFGGKKKITVPNINNFDRSKYHCSNLCFGMSLIALTELMKKKKFYFVGTNILRNNAFFISDEYPKNKFFPKLKIQNIEKNAYSNISESRNKKKGLNYLKGASKLDEISNCEVIDLSKSKNKKVKLKSIFDKFK